MQAAVRLGRLNRKHSSSGASTTSGRKGGTCVEKTVWLAPVACRRLVFGG